MPRTARARLAVAVTLGLTAASVAFAGGDRYSKPPIAYAKFPASGHAQLYAIAATGGKSVRLLRHNGSDSEPAWSPDGSRIAFTSVGDDQRQGLFVATADSAQVGQLTSHVYDPSAPLLDAHPRWSPDGTKIVFHRYRNSGSQLYVINADGSRPRSLGGGFEPAWSPDGKEIAFALRVGRYATYDIYRMRADGGPRRRVTRNPANDNDPDWSPDGRWLAFESNRNDNTDIYVIRADGTQERRLTHAQGYDVSPVWSPDGKRIAFASRRLRGQFDIYVMNANGAHETRLTRDEGAEDAQPSWRR